MEEIVKLFTKAFVIVVSFIIIGILLSNEIEVPWYLTTIASATVVDLFGGFTAIKKGLQSLMRK